MVFYQCRCPQGEWDRMAEKMMLEFGESGHPVFRATSPLSRGPLKSKGGGKLSIHYCADQDMITTVFRTITSVNQLSLYGAVAEMCEEYESLHDRTGRPVVGGQSSSSFVPSVIMTIVPLNSDDSAHKEFPLQRYKERIEKLSQQDKLSKFCMDAGFLNVVEIGQYSIKEDSPQGIWDKIAVKMLIEFAESGCPIFRATTPLSRGKLKSRLALLPLRKQLRLFFA